MDNKTFIQLMDKYFYMFIRTFISKKRSEIPTKNTLAEKKIAAKT